VVAIVASVGLALAFVLKDYASSLAAGVVTILEGPYSPGLIKMDGTYGEVKQIGVRAVHLVTAYDNEVIIPHSRRGRRAFRTQPAASHSVLCVANFYLHPDHDGEAVRRRLVAVGETSGYLMPGTQVNVSRRRSPGARTTS